MAVLLRCGLILIALTGPALAGQTLIEENDAVKITRVTVDPGETYETHGCSPDRVIVWASDQRKRHKRADKEEIRDRKAGEAKFFPATCDPVTINNPTKQTHTSVVIELKKHETAPYPPPTYNTVPPHVGRMP